MAFKWGEATQFDPERIASCCYTDGYVYKYHGSHRQIVSCRVEKPLSIKWYIDLHETAAVWLNEPQKPIPSLSQGDCSQREGWSIYCFLLHLVKNIRNLTYILFLPPAQSSPTRLFPCVLYQAIMDQTISLFLQIDPNLAFVHQRNPPVQTVFSISVDSPVFFVCRFL